MDVFKKLLAAAASKLSAGQRTRLQWNDGSVCCLMDSKGENLYCVVTSLLTYPERLAYQLLYDLVAQASQEPDLATAPEHGLNERLQPKMKELVLYYEDAKNFPQFALGVSRESMGTAPTSSIVPPGDGGGNRNRNILIILVIVVIVGVVGYFVTQQGSAVKAVTGVAAIEQPELRGATESFLPAARLTNMMAQSGANQIQKDAFIMA